MTIKYTDSEKFAALLTAVAFGLVGAGICEFISSGLVLP